MYMNMNWSRVTDEFGVEDGRITVWSLLLGNYDFVLKFLKKL